MPDSASRGPRLNAIVVAAGSSIRFGASKLFVPLAGRPLLCTTLESICVAPVTRLVIVCRAQDRHAVDECVRKSHLPHRVRVHVAEGGATRAESVAHGLDVLVASGVRDGELLLVHDGARPLPGAPLLKRLLAAKDAGNVVIPVVPMYDSLRRNIDDETMAIDRSAVVGVQTPQLLAVGVLRSAIASVSDVARFGDEATLVEAAGGRVATVAGEVGNRKITVPEDVMLAEGLLRARAQVVVGFGYDVHRFAPARALTLAGVEIPSDVGLEGTSDADAVLHAVMDAILGCSGSGDIGGMFPSSDRQYAGISSTVLLERVMKLRRTTSLRLLSLDVTIVAERPRLQKYQLTMQRRLASLLGLHLADVDVKVTGNDGIGWIGRGEGIAAMCVVTALRRR